MKVTTYDKNLFTAPVYNTFPAFLEGIGRDYADRPALSWFTRRREEQTLTYGELVRRATALRRSLRKRGMSQGDHIAILSENSADWVTIFLSVTSFGCVAVCADTEQSDDSIRDMICRSDAKMLFLTPAYLPVCLPLLDSGALERIFLIGGLTSDQRVETLNTLYEQGFALMENESEEPFEVSEAAPAELVFTSGTTSQSKMVLLSQRAVMQNIREESYNIYFYDRMFSSLPFYHSYGLNCAVLHALLRGIHLYINGDLKTAMRDLTLAKVESMLTVPLMLEAIHNQIWLSVEKEGRAEELRRQLKRSSMCKKLHLPFKFPMLETLRAQVVGTLHTVACGGASLSVEISEFFESMGIQVLQGYGITECSPLISVNCNYANKPGSVGLPLRCLEVRLDDGEVCVKGPSVMTGYYKDPEQTAEAIQDGWFHTGDLGYLDKDGFLFLTGRKKNLIVFKNGKKISPEKLEELISAIPMVKEVMVSGTANGALADDVKLTASIYPDPQRTEGMTSYEILEHLQRAIDKINNDLPSYQQIQLVNIREKEFTKTATKKIKRHAN